MRLSEEITREIRLLINSPREWFRIKYPTLFKNAFREPVAGIHKDPCITLFELTRIADGTVNSFKRCPRRKWQLRFLMYCVYKHYGTEGVKACVLYYAMNRINYYVTRSMYFTPNDILERIEAMFEELIMPSKEELERYPFRAYKPTDVDYAISEATKEVIEFIKQNIVSIIEDIKG